MLQPLEYDASQSRKVLEYEFNVRSSVWNALALIWKELASRVMESDVVKERLNISRRAVLSGNESSSN